MVAFDSPSREFCVSRRIRTNTPLQALVTLNDPVYLEAAQGLARLMREAGGEDLEAGIRHGYKRALAREADEETVAVLIDLFQKAQSELDNVQVRTVAAKEVELSDPMDIVANAILNLDAFLTKD